MENKTITFDSVEFVKQVRQMETLTPIQCYNMFSAYMEQVRKQSNGYQSECAEELKSLINKYRKKYDNPLWGQFDEWIDKWSDHI